MVTGGGRGIGRGIVWELAARGFSVVVNYRSDAAWPWNVAARQRLGALPAPCLFQADVADLHEGRRLLEHALDQFRPGRSLGEQRRHRSRARLDLLETTPESWDDVLATNLRGPFFLTQAVAVAMLDLKQAAVVAEPQIVFITSISSSFASVNRGEYCVSKAGLSMVAQLFAVRLAGQGILVYEIRPGLIDTDMTRPVHAGLRREDRGRNLSDSPLGTPRTWAVPSPRWPRVPSPSPPAR